MEIATCEGQYMYSTHKDCNNLDTTYKSGKQFNLYSKELEEIDLTGIIIKRLKKFCMVLLLLMMQETY